MLKNRIYSFKHAFNGFIIALKDQPNLKFHISAGFITILLGWFLGISTFEWLIIILVIGLVVSVELTNTAIEEVVDSFTNDPHPAAKIAKDVSAGAVLVVSLTALIIGLLIFLPYLLKLSG